MDLSDLTGSVTEKLTARSRRVGIPDRAVLMEVTDPGSIASLYLCGDDGSRTEIIRLTCRKDDSCSVYVREPAFSHSGVPKDASGDCAGDDGWHMIDYAVPDEETARRISLYCADVLEFEFGVLETDAEPFECCSRQYTCSIRGECLHPNQLYAKACKYRKTLLSGNKY